MPKRSEQFYLPKQDTLDIVKNILLKNTENLQVVYKNINKEIVLFLDENLTSSSIESLVGENLFSKIIIFENNSQTYIRKKTNMYYKNKDYSDDYDQDDYTVIPKNKPIKKIVKKNRFKFKKKEGYRIGRFNIQIK